MHTNSNDRVAPLTDPVGIARNALSLLDVRDGAGALVLIGSAGAGNAFCNLVRAMAIHENDPGSLEAASLAVSSLSSCPVMVRWLLPWPCPDMKPEPGKMQAAISLRVFRRNDLKGWAARLACGSGVTLDGAAPFLSVNSPAETVRKDGHLCLIDGKVVPSLSRHIARLGISPKAYREFFGLPKDYGL